MCSEVEAGVAFGDFKFGSEDEVFIGFLGDEKAMAGFGIFAGSGDDAVFSGPLSSREGIPAV